MSKFYNTDLVVNVLKGQLKTKTVDKKKVKFFYLEVELDSNPQLVNSYCPLYTRVLWDVTADASEPRTFTSIDFGEQNVYPLMLQAGSTTFNNVSINKFNAKCRDLKVWITVGFEIPEPKNTTLLEIFKEEAVISITKKQLELFKEESDVVQTNLLL